MQRLLDDAEKISGIKYDISSFADVTQAIHVIQTELGITGTTALEASSTIQGSISSMKAAWANLLVAFANPEQDLSVAIDNLKNSLSAVADNLLPRIGEVFGSIFGSIPTPILAVASAIGAVVAGITAYNAVMEVKNVLDAIQEAGSIKLALAQIGLNTAMLASPITWVVAGIAALVAAFVILWNKCEGFRNFWIGLWELLKGTLTSIWEEHIKPLWEGHLQPAIQAIMGKLTELWEIVIKPVIDKTVAILKDLWDNVLKPIVDWLVSFFVERFKFAFDTIKSVIQTAKEIIATVIDSIKNIFTGIIDFIVGVFTGDWKKAWNGIKKVFSSIWDAIKGVAIAAWDGIKGIFSGVKQFFVDRWNVIKKVFENVGTWFKNIFTSAWNGIKTAFANVGSFFSGIWNKVKNAFSSVKTWFGDVFKGAWTNVKNVFSGASKFFKGVWDGIKNAFGKVTDWFKNVFSKAWEGVKNVFSTGGKIFDGIKDGILNGLKVVINAIIKGINKVVEVPFNGINNALKLIKEVEILGFRPFDWIETIGVPKIPLLAQGSVIPPNKEFMAILGDNTKEHEIVSPLSTMKQAFTEAMLELGGNFGGGNTEVVLEIDGREFGRAVVEQGDRENRRIGTRLVIA